MAKASKQPIDVTIPAALRDQLAGLEQKLAELDDFKLQLGNFSRTLTSFSDRIDELERAMRESAKEVSARVSHCENALDGVAAGVNAVALTREEFSAIVEVDPAAEFDVMEDWKATHGSQRLSRGQTVRADRFKFLGDWVGSGLKLRLTDAEREEREAKARSDAAAKLKAKHVENLARRAAAKATEAAEAMAEAEAAEAAQ